MDVDQEYKFLGRLAIAQDVEAYADEVIPYCSDVFSAQSVLAVRFSRMMKPNVLFRWVPNEVLRRTFDHFYPKVGYMFDPFYQVAFEVDNHEVFHLRDIAPDKFESSDYFSNYFGITGMVDEVGGIIRIDESSSLHLSFGRNAGRRRFRASEVNRFRRLGNILLPKLKDVVSNTPLPPMSSSQSIREQILNVDLDKKRKVSRREAEIAELIIQGHSSRAISLKLKISIQTVKVHRRNLYKKLNISSQNELFALLIEQHDDAK